MKTYLKTSADALCASTYINEKFSKPMEVLVEDYSAYDNTVIVKAVDNGFRYLVNKIDLYSE